MPVAVPSPRGGSPRRSQVDKTEMLREVNSAPAGAERQVALVKGILSPTDKEDSVVYKDTTLPHIVVKRRVRLVPTGFVTYQEDKVTTGRLWPLHRRCMLVPADAALIRPHDRHIRKAGPLSAVRAYRDKRPLKLYCFKVEWPERHAPSAGSSIELGFESLDEARAWHALIAGKLQALMAAAPSTAMLNHQVSNASDGADGPATTDITPLQSPGSSRELSRMGSLQRESSGEKGAGSSPAAASAAAGSASNVSGSSGHGSMNGLAEQGSAKGPSLVPIESVRPGVLHNAHKDVRWVPYKHTNGMALYYHHAPQTACGGHSITGGEYMVSTTIQATPRSCLRALEARNTSTHLVRTASYVRVLQEKDNVVIRHMVFEGTGGMAGTLCAPREVYLREVIVSYDEGIYAWLFTSLPDSEVKPEWEAAAQRAFTAARRTKSDSDPTSTHLFQWGAKPVRAYITGAVTFSALEGYTAQDSSQTLATCIVRGDFGGWVSRRSYFHRLTQFIGMETSLMERLLMGMLTVKDEVEFNRFRSKPFEMIEQAEEEGRQSQAAAAASQAEAVALRAYMSQPQQLLKQLITSSGKPQGEETASPASSVSGRAAAAVATGSAAKAAAARASADGVTAERVPTLESTTEWQDVSTSEPSMTGGYTAEQYTAMAGGSMPHRFWEPMHSPGYATVFSVRGPRYLVDKKKVAAGNTMYYLHACDLVATRGPLEHVARYLPSVRSNPAAWSFVVNLMVPGNPVLHLVLVFSTDRHPDSLGPCPDDPSDAGERWTPFDLAMARFLHGTPEERDGMFKMIPHCAKGSWIISQSVGTTPVILGRKLRTAYYTTPRYIEVDIDINTNSAVSYIVNMVQGATKSMVIDHGYLLEGQYAHELPEVLFGAARFKHLDMQQYTWLNTEAELPFVPVQEGWVAEQREAQQAAAA